MHNAFGGSRRLNVIMHTKRKSERRRHSNCKTYWKCRDCDTKIITALRKPGEHVCGESRCNNCKQWVMDPDHPCYLQQKKLKPPSEKYAIFDFEAGPKPLAECECGKRIIRVPCAWVRRTQCATHRVWRT